MKILFAWPVVSALVDETLNLATVSMYTWPREPLEDICLLEGKSFVVWLVQEAVEEAAEEVVEEAAEEVMEEVVEEVIVVGDNWKIKYQEIVQMNKFLIVCRVKMKK